MNGETSVMPKRRLGELEGRSGITGGPEGSNRPGIELTTYRLDLSLKNVEPTRENTGKHFSLNINLSCISGQYRYR